MFNEYRDQKRTAAVIICFVGGYPGISQDLRLEVSKYHGCGKDMASRERRSSTNTETRRQRQHISWADVSPLFLLKGFRAWLHTPSSEVPSRQRIFEYTRM